MGTAEELLTKYLKLEGKTRAKQYLEVRNGKWEPEFKKKLNEEKAFITMGRETDTKWSEAVVKAVYNISENDKGNLINLLIVNKKYSEGLSLKTMRVCHILEPPESNSLKDQIIGRCVRDCSHKNIPYKDWNVKIYTYYSTIDNQESINENKEDILEFSEGEFNKQIQEINERERLRKLYEGPLQTPEGELLDEKRVTRCVNNYQSCIEGIDKEDSEYTAKKDKCLNKKNYCITNSKIGRDPNAIELDTIKDKHKYDYIDDIILKRDLKAKYEPIFQKEEKK